MNQASEPLHDIPDLPASGSGVAMDRAVQHRRWPNPWLALPLGLVLAGLAWWLLPVFEARSSFTLDGQRVRIAEVSRGRFSDVVATRATVEPERTVYLDAVEGGRVEEVLVEEGALVAAGQPLVRLSNASLQLDVIGREAEVSEQLNNLRNTRLAIEQNRLSLRGELIEIDYRIRTLERQVERNARLSERNLLPEFEVEDALDELRYWRERRAVTRESQAQDERIRLAQVEQLESGVQQLERNLAIASANLENLLIRAPRAGQLTALDAELGQSKRRGERLGQIDDVDRFRAQAMVNEFYLGRVRTGQTATLTLNGADHELTVDKVYPEVRNAQFRIDLRFDGAAPVGIRRGQTLALRLQLGGDEDNVVLLPNGAFINDTGGAWVFVLDRNGRTAQRRQIELGRRNPNTIEVLSGLLPGDRVLVSSYREFIDVAQVQLADN